MKLRLPPKPPEHRPIAQVLADVRMMQNPLSLFDEEEFVAVLEEFRAITGTNPTRNAEDMFAILPTIETDLAARLTHSHAQQTEAPEPMQTRSNPTLTETPTNADDEALVKQYEALTDFRAKSLFLDKHGERLRELIREEQAAHRGQHNPNQGTP